MVWNSRLPTWLKFFEYKNPYNSVLRRGMHLDPGVYGRGFGRGRYLLYMNRDSPHFSIRINVVFGFKTVAVALHLIVRMKKWLLVSFAIKS